MTTDFFPQGLATGENFCNRLEERKQLSTNIKTIRPTLIMSPRRYGKTSLVLFVLDQLKLPFTQIDLYSELDEGEVQNTILGAIGDILYSTESVPQKALKFVADFFSSLSVSFTMENAQVRVQFSKSKNSPAKNILSSLKKLDEILQAKNKTAVFFMDEFQRLAQISESATIEGALRHIAQSSKNIMFVFSGSNRHLLNSMFDDKNKPLYKLCDRMILDRISQKDYLPFIQKKAEKKWGKPVSEDVVEIILSTAELHPYYVNVLCYKLWMLHDLPSKEDVESIWHKYAMEEKTNILNEIDLLSANQAKMLIAIAKYGEELLPTGKDFLLLTKFSLSSAAQKKDYIYSNDNNKYCIVDPLIKYIFSHKSIR
jgi:AAA+ ATPase superfamily predicted ATPase